MELQFSGPMWFWKGPSPFHFVSVPDEESADLEALSPQVSYGWGMIPVTAAINETIWTTSLFPKDGGYIVPIKLAVQKAQKLRVGDVVPLRLTVDV